MGGIRSLIEKQRSFYLSVVSVFCPILGDTVYLTSQGFKHLLYRKGKGGGVPRKIDEQYMKLKCLSHAPDVVKNCTLVPEIRSEETMVKGKIKSITYYELAHEVSPGEEIRVVVKKIGTGKLKFWSVMTHNSKTRKSIRRKSKKRQ